ncbi:MAG: TolC family outer membrane protein [Rhodobacteraceae bacterium]|nr:TolC family outer membrane protein [Paracoccaceae bacterium]
MGNRRITAVLRRAALAGSVAVAALATTTAARADNLTDALIGAYRTSGLLDQNRALLRAADEDVAIALSALRPIVTWVARATQNFNRVSGGGVTISDTDELTLSTGIRIQQLLFDGGAAILTRRAAQETVLATRQSLLSVEQRVLLRAAAAYAGVLLQQENVALRQNNLRLLQEELKAAQDRFDVGEVTRTDVALAESRVAAAQANLTDARGALIDAKSEYANAVGNDPGVVSEQPQLPQRPASVETARQLALRNHPDILAEQHRVKAAEITVQSTSKALGPSVNLQADLFVSERYSGLNRSINDTTLTIEMQQNLYAGGRLAANLRKSRAAEDAARAVLLTAQRDVAQDVNDAYVQLEVARANLVSSREQIRAAQVAFDGIREEATLGARTTLDVLQAEQNLLDAETARISARASEIIAAFTLLQSQGLLTAERLGLAVEIYDPTLYYNLVKDAPAQRSKQSKDLDRVLEALGKK